MTKKPDKPKPLAANSTLSKRKRIRELEKAGALIAAEIDRLEAGRGEK